MYNLRYFLSYCVQKNQPDFVDHQNTTCFFNKFQWNKGFDFFIDKYKNTDKVNVYSLGCSDCSEALSIAMIIDTKLNGKGDKFFPIIAVDNDNEITSMFKQGYIALNTNDVQAINHYTNNNLDKYLTKTSINYYADNNSSKYRRYSYTQSSDRIKKTDERKTLTLYKISPELLKKIKVVNADVKDYINLINDKNNLIFARNFWVEVHNDSEKLLRKLSEKTDKNSFLVLGDYDFLACPLTCKNAFGFSMNPYIDNVFDKSGSNYFDDMRIFNKDMFTDY